MVDSETYMNVKFTKTDSNSPSRDDLDATYALLNLPKYELHFAENQDPPTVSGYGEISVTAQEDGLNSTYAVVNREKAGLLFDDDEYPPTASGTAELSVAAKPDGLDATYTLLNLPKNKLHIAENQDLPIASGSDEISVTAQEDGLNSTYAVVKRDKDGLLIDNDEDPPTASGPAELSVATEGDGLNSTYAVVKRDKDGLLIDNDEDPPTASGPAELSVATEGDGLNSTYSVLMRGKDELLLDDDEYPATASSSAEISVIAEADGLNSTYSVPNRPKEEHLMEEYEDPLIASGPADVSVTEQPGPKKLESNENIGISPGNKIRLLCVVTFVLFAIVVGLSIYVSLIRESLKRVNSDLRQQLTGMETNYKSVNETKAQICELLASRKEQACSPEWERNKNRCYFISKPKLSYNEARQHCSNSDSRLLEIESEDEEYFTHNAVRDEDSSYWIGACKSGKVASKVVFKVNAGKFECGECKSLFSRGCKDAKLRFICEKSPFLCPDIPEQIRDFCHQPAGPT